MIYEYISNSGTIIERTYAMRDAIPPQVEQGGVVYRRHYRPVGVIYRGYGFKVTDSYDSVTRWQREQLDTY
jgi:predicted nucleic acid-binding Zn ribbon protein